MTAKLSDHEFEEILTSYRTIEIKVSRMMHVFCAPHCSVCTTRCCRPDICREAAKSPFLLAVHQTTRTFTKATGYLGCTGCTLATGRPPICHAFLCGAILKALPDDLTRYALECLADLVDHLGKSLCRNRHLVEALTEAALRTVDIHEFLSRLQDTESAMFILERFFTDKIDFEPAEIKSLAKIRRPPPQLV